MTEELLNADRRPDAAPMDVSIVIYVNDHLQDAAEMYAYVADYLIKKQMSFEFIYVNDGNYKSVLNSAEVLKSFARSTRMIHLPRYYGVSTAMSIGFKQARGKLILTMGSFLQTDPAEIDKMFKKIEEGFDFVNGWRVNRKDTFFNQMHTRVYNWMIRKAANVDLHDTNCTLKLFKKSVVDDLPIYGDFYRFLPVQAIHHGYSVAEVAVNQRREMNEYGIYPIVVYVRRLLDIIALLFIGRFVRKPLRFFGLVGTGLFSLGLLINVYLVLHKYVHEMPIAGRPLLLLGVLLMVLGVQTASVGLIGELVLFTHAKQIKDYHIDQIVG